MKNKFFYLLLLSLAYSFQVVAQVTIAPTNLYIDDSNRFGTYMVINGSNTPQEISVEFIYSYNKTDSLGNREYIYDDEASEKEHSIANSVKAFPKNFVLQPNQRQIVRIRVSSPSNTSDGTYWSRIKTTSMAQSPPVEIEADNQVSARIGVKFEQITSLFYKQGNVTTGIDIEKIRTSFSNDSLIIYTDYDRVGNSPFLGTITSTLESSSGDVVAQSPISTTIHIGGTQRHIIKTEDIPSGTYKLTVEFATNRSDISPDNLVQMQPVTATTTITIP